MIGDLSIIVKNDFNQRSDEKVTLKKIEETTEMLNRELKTDVFKTFQDPEYNDYEVIDTRKDNDEIMEITIYDGFWMIDTGWRYHQYFHIHEGKLWLRDMMSKYVRLLGATEAYVCIEYNSWNSQFWKDEKTTFDDWLAGCTADLGHSIETLNLNDSTNFYTEKPDYKEPVYLDIFKD